jgi:creatinine amidohydrolase
MRLSTASLVALLVGVMPATSPPAAQTQPAAATDRGRRLEDLTWREAELALKPETVVVIPVGAASKEHGPHLKLRNDLTLAEYLTRRVLEAVPVVVAPTLTYHHYPAFVEYPGSTTLSLDTARDLTIDVVKSLTAHGPRRFYVLNTGISTVPSLAPAAKALSAEGVLMRYTDLGRRLDSATRGLIEQQGGTHADEVETSMMLYIDPASVDMSKAVKDYTPSTGAQRLTRQRGGTGTYSPSGIWGDPTFATRDKGRVFVEALVAGILEDIAQLRTAPLPSPTAAAAIDTPPAAPSPAPRPTSVDPENESGRCESGDDRAIRGIGDRFTTLWANGDAVELGKLWARFGDIIHTDGSIERGPIPITQNRAALFGRREYRHSRHLLVLNLIRCLSPDTAVADGKWDLRGVLDTAGKPLPIMEGQATLVLKRHGLWKIEAYRYTVKAPTTQVPTTAKQPGMLGVIK